MNVANAVQHLERYTSGQTVNKPQQPHMAVVRTPDAATESSKNVVECVEGMKRSACVRLYWLFDSSIFAEPRQAPQRRCDGDCGRC